jgi:flagella basal body P-ring formation protein FlgA
MASIRQKTDLADSKQYPCQSIDCVSPRHLPPKNVKRFTCRGKKLPLARFTAAAARWLANCRRITRMPEVPMNRRARVPHVCRSLAAIVLMNASAFAGPDAAFESLESIRAAAEAYVRAQLPPDASIAGISADRLDPRLHFARCPSALRARLPSGAVLQARTTVGVSCDSGAQWTVYVPVTTESVVSMLVLRRPVAQNERLGVEDVEVQKRKLSGTGVAYLTNVADLRRRTVRRPLPVGTALSIDMFTPDMLIHQGQEVTLVATVGGLQVRARGRALANGSAGARLRVQNLSSLKVVEGVVEDEDVIRVAL